MDESRPKNIGSLTVLKFMAVLLIIWWHFVGEPIGTFRIGTRAVEFLFVASGFLVGYNYYHQGMPNKISYCFKYVFKKLKKIYPLHVFCIIAVIILFNDKYILGIDYSKFQILLVHLFLLQSWVPYTNHQQYMNVIHENYNGASWFLSGLLFCYFISPLLINIIKKKRFLSLLLFFLVTILMVWIDFCTMRGGIFHIANTSVVYCALKYCMGMFMVPIFFMLKEKITERKVVNVLASILEVCVLVFACFIMIKFDAYSYKFNALFALLFCVVVFVFAFDLGYFSILCQKIALLRIADIQLEMYLLHVVVYFYLEAFFKSFGLILGLWPMFLLTISVLFIVSITYKIFIEGSFANLLDKLYYKLRGKPAVPPTTESAAH